MFMYIYICIYIFTHTHTHMYIRIIMRIVLAKCVRKHIYTCIYVYAMYLDSRDSQEEEEAQKQLI